MHNWQSGRKILLGITGGIAAYKIPALVRLIRKSGCEVEIILTQSAENFVTHMTLATLAGHRVWREKDFVDSGHEIPHIKLSDWADVIAIAPCSANTLAKIAHGICDNLLTSTILAAHDERELIIFPAMNENMFNNKATQENIKILLERGVRVINPSEGDLACGVSGKGRMPEPDEIFLEIMRSLCPVHDMTGKRVLITAGPTHEYLDPVRFISNPSTGKMGAAMARSAWLRGADVKIIAGPVKIDSYGFEVVHVTSALDMLREVKANLEWADYIVKAAAVGDYRPKEYNADKIKREGRDNLTLELIQNPDIAAEAGKLKREGQILIGFAAESQHVKEYAREKLSRKNLDYIIANDITGEDSGFAHDTNRVTLISADETKPERTFTGLKQDIAFDIWSALM